jgi:hypothetical protein
MRTHNERRRLEPGQMCDQSIKNYMGARHLQTVYVCGEKMELYRYFCNIPIAWR